MGTKILILDEPTSALGQKQQMEVLKTIKKVQRLGNIAIILITHNEIHARLIADRYTFLSLGEVIGNGLASELGGQDVKRLMAGGAEIGDLAKSLSFNLTKIALIGEFHDAGKEILTSNKINFIEIFDYDFEYLKKQLADCDAIGVRTAKLPAEVLSHCKSLKIVARHGVGYDTVSI